MAEDKEIRIRAVLDASTFDKGVNEIQEKLRKITQQQNQGAGAQKALGKDSVMGKYAQQAFGDFSKESQRQLEAMYKTQRQEAVSQQVTMKGKQQELDKMVKADGELTKQQKERVKSLKEEIDLLKEKHRQTLATAGETQKALDKMKPPNDPPNDPPSGPPGGGSGGGGDDGGPVDLFKKYLSRMSMAAGAAAIYKGGMNAWSDSITRDRVMNSNIAASATMGSREMREGMSGQGSRGMFWMSERQKAMRSATTEGDRQRNHDLVSAGVKGAAGAAAGGYAGLVGGGVLGAKIGGGIGAMFGGVGALPGAVIGAGVGALGGAIGGAYLGGQATTSERDRARLFDQKKYNTMKTKEDLENYEQELASAKAKDPRRQLAREYFEQNSDQIAAMQKLTGSGTDREYLGGDNVGILQRQMKYGGQFGGTNFSQQTIEQQMQALASGGAMTEGVRELGGAAATYNRQFNLSNAGQTMGRMQGNTGANSSLTDMAYQRLMTEAVRLGVDTSSMPRELEKMTQITAELTTAGGVNAEGMSDLFAGALTGYNNKAQEAAATSAEGYKQTGKEAGGWEGQMGMGFLQGSRAKELLGSRKLSAMEMNTLNQTSAAELDEAGLARMAKTYTGGDTEKMKKLLEEKDKYKQGRTGAEDEAAKNLGEYLKKSGVKTPEDLEKAISTDEGAKLYENLRTQKGAAKGDFFSRSQVQQKSDLILEASQAADFKPGTTMEIAAGKVEEQKKKGETRAAYVEEGARATGDMARIEALNENLESFKTAAKGYTAAAVEYNKQFELVIEATKKGAKGMDEVAKHLEELDQRLREGSLGGGGMPSSGKPPGQR